MRTPLDLARRVLPAVFACCWLFSSDSQGVEILWLQTNHEGEFVEQIQGLRGTADGALINAAALTHTSLALRDALLAAEVPFV